MSAGTVRDLTSAQRPSLLRTLRCILLKKLIQAALTSLRHSSFSRNSVSDGKGMGTRAQFTVIHTVTGSA